MRLGCNIKDIANDIVLLMFTIIHIVNSNYAKRAINTLKMHEKGDCQLLNHQAIHHKLLAGVCYTVLQCC